MDGAEFEELAQGTDTTPSDIVRHFRMAVQLMRQVRRAIDPSWNLCETLTATMENMNRDIVDARRQLELG
jgi:superfamily II RNA helicase